MPISLKKQSDLFHRMTALNIHERDIREHFVHSSGRGGQNVNKVSTCVVLKHIPTGIEVKCQKERSQALNRFIARRILAEKIERMMLGAKSEAEQRIWKIRKQKRRRSRKAKEKILENKKRQSEIKRSRTALRYHRIREE